MAHELLDFGLEILNALAAAADNHAGLAGVQRHRHAGGAALHVDAGNAAGVELFLEHLAQIEIFNQVVGEIFLSGEPAGAPIEDHAHARAMRINFLTHE